MMEESLIADIAEAKAVLADFVGATRPVCGMILGSGLNVFADELDNVRVLSFAEVPHMKTSTATGHKGRFVLGTIPENGKTVLCMQGRLHGYEGNSAQQVAFPVWVMHEVGIETLITTNAAGAINARFEVGDFCLMSDQINFTGRNPLVGREPDRLAERFVPMMDAFDPALRGVVLEVARREGIGMREGVYLGLLGPSFETPAEIRAFAALGADTVAMSVVEEVIAARHVGMRVVGLSMISNMACGVGEGDPTSEEIMDVAKLCEEKFHRLMAGVVSMI